MSPLIVLCVRRWISKSYCWKGLKYAEDTVKPKNVQDLEDFSEEQWDSQTTITDMKTVVDHQTVKIQGYVHF